MNIAYDNELNKIDVFQVHPSFLPFVGDNYDEYRVLHVGESHFIGQSVDNEEYDIEYFQKWWTDPCIEVEERYWDWFTRPVIRNYMNNKKGSYSIFNNFLKSFCRTVLKQEISINKESKQLYNYMAFMNYFQMPSIYEGVKYWDSLWKSAKKRGNKQLAYDMWEIACQNATETLDTVIDILKPKAVVITSISAGCAYKEYGGKYADSIVFTSHPGYPFTWQKPLKSLDGQKGIDVCENSLKEFFS